MHRPPLLHLQPASIKEEVNDVTTNKDKAKILNFIVLL